MKKNTLWFGLLLLTAMSCDRCTGCECYYKGLDQDTARCASQYGSDKLVTCYTPFGQQILKERSHGEVMRQSGGGVLFLSRRTGQHVVSSGPCVITAPE